MKLSAAEISSLLFAEQGSNPATPATGFGRLYIKTDGVYFISDGGAVTGPFGAAGGGGTFVRTVRQTLTDKTTFAGATQEQWGTEEATIDDAVLPSLTGVTVNARVIGTAQDFTSTNALAIEVEISLDGGSTWSTGLAVHDRIPTGGTSSFRFPIVAEHLVTGTVTGDIQARAMGTSAAAASHDLMRGAIYLTASVDV